MKGKIKKLLSGGKRTSVGEAENVIKEVFNSPALLKEVYSLFLDDDPVVVMRSSYVDMKVSENVSGKQIAFAFKPVQH